MTDLKILFDTNAFYACEDISAGRQHANARIATELKELALRHGSELFLIPETESEYAQLRTRRCAKQRCLNGGSGSTCLRFTLEKIYYSARTTSNR